MVNVAESSNLVQSPDNIETFIETFNCDCFECIFTDIVDLLRQLLNFLISLFQKWLSLLILHITAAVNNNWSGAV